MVNQTGTQEVICRLLLPGVTQKFIGSTTMSGYEEALGTEFGKLGHLQMNRKLYPPEEYGGHPTFSMYFYCNGTIHENRSSLTF